MAINLFDKVEQVTENPEYLIRIFLPQLRSLSYFAEKSITQDSKFEVANIQDLMKCIPEYELTSLITEINSLNTFLISKDNNDSKQTFADILKYYLFFTSHVSLLKHYLGKFVSFVKGFWGRKEQNESLETHIISIREKTKSIFLTTSENGSRYAKIIDDYIFIGYYAIGTCLLFRLAEKTHCQWNQKDLLRFSLVFCCARMEYELRNLHQTQWQPMLVNLLAQNGGRFFRLCCVSFGDQKIPIYKVVSDSLFLDRAITPEWHDSLYKETQRIESIHNIGLNRLFVFYMADLFITNSLSTQKSYINALKTLYPYPDLHTLKRYFNLFLQADLYTSKVDTNTWQPSMLIRDYLYSNEMNYEEKEHALREEYFPEDVYDLNALLNYAAEYYNEKIHLDFEYGNVDNLDELDNNSIWYLSEWLIRERQYDFLHDFDVNTIASMIGRKITS